MSLFSMEAFFGLLWLWVSMPFSRSQCVLEKEYFCSSIPDSFPEGLTSILFVVTNLGVVNSSVFNSPNLVSITSLALANSGITKIEPGAFHAFQSLTKLSLYQNSLTHVSDSWLSNPGRLENLTVAQNLISQIGPTAFAHFSNLTALNLANNQIWQLDGRSFEGLSRLKWLDLSGNNLTTLTRSVFDVLAAPPAMKLGSNPWNCSCRLQDFGLYLQELINSSLLDDADSVVCHSPPSFQGIHVWNISHSNCSPGFPSLTSQNSFSSAGLPALLASLVFISILVLLSWLGMVNRENKQVRPSKEVVDSPVNARQSIQVDAMVDHQQTEGKIRTPTLRMVAETGRLKSTKSASAILLRTEFRKGQCRAHNLTETHWERLMAPYVFVNDKMYDGGHEDLSNFTELLNFQKLEESHRNRSPGKSKVDGSTTPMEGSVETSGFGVHSKARHDVQNTKISEAPEKDNVNHRDGVENPEPFSYLTVATAPTEQIETEAPKDVIAKVDKSQIVSLKRALTWPYERNIGSQRSEPLNLRGSFMAQFHLPSVHLSKTMDAAELESHDKWLDMRPTIKEQHCGDWNCEFGIEVNLAKQKESLFQKDSKTTLEESIDVGKSEFEEQQLRQSGQMCLGVHDLDEDDVNTEAKPTRSPDVKLQKEPNVAVVARYVHNPPPGIEATRCPTGVKAKRLPKSVSSLTRPHHEICPSPMPSVDMATTSSSYDNNVLLENNAYNYMNLLHEVVENRGRWTRERWKQTHQNRALSKSK